MAPIVVYEPTKALGSTLHVCLSDLPLSSYWLYVLGAGPCLHRSIRDTLTRLHSPARELLGVHRQQPEVAKLLGR